MKSFLIFTLFICFSITWSSPVSALSDQGEIIVLIKEAMQGADANKLAQLFDEIVEISFNGTKSNYSRTQAEFIMRDFFQKNIPNDFKYIHNGTSRTGIQYAIAEYHTPNQSFKMYLLLKEREGSYFIDTIDISRE